MFFIAAACIAGLAYIRSTANVQFPDLFLPFPRNTSWLILIITLPASLAVFLYRSELRRGARILHRKIRAPVIDEEKRSSLLLSRKIESTENRMSTTEQALNRFAAAISDYAQHLASHTSAIRGLAEASHELKTGAAGQNRVISYLLQSIERAGVIWEAPPVKNEKPGPEETTTPATIHRPYSKPGIFDKPMPPGCALSRETRARQALKAQKEISSALKGLQDRLEKAQGHV